MVNNRQTNTPIPAKLPARTELLVDLAAESEVVPVLVEGAEDGEIVLGRCVGFLDGS